MAEEKNNNENDPKKRNNPSGSQQTSKPINSQEKENIPEIPVSISPDISVEELFKLSILVGERRRYLADQREKLTEKKEELLPQLRKLRDILKPKSKVKSKIKSIDLQSPSLNSIKKLEHKLAISALSRELFVVNETLARINREYRKVVGSEITANKIQRYKDQAQSSRYLSQSYNILERAILKTLNEVLVNRIEDIKKLHDLANEEEKDEQFKSLLLDLLKEESDDRIFIFCSTKNSQAMLMPGIKETLRIWNEEVKIIEQLTYPAEN